MLKTAIITGGHHYHVPAFHQLFRELPGIDAYVQHMADFVASPPEARQEYDVLVFYAHLRGEVTDLGLAPGRNDTVQSVLESLGTAKPGIVVLHHGLLAFPGWTIWDDIVGLPDRSLSDYAHDQPIDCHIADANHPICAALADWTMTDETYLMPDAVGGDNHILITTEHPRSMKTLAWTRTYKLSRVFCLQGGDNQRAWGNPHFRTLLSQGICWCARVE